MDCEIPLADSEVEKAARSAWRYEREGRNLVGRGRAVVISHGLLDRLIAANQDAFILLTVLKRHHWGRDFVLSKNMADTLGWLGVDWSSDATTLALKGLPGGVTAAEAFIKVVEEAGSFASYDPVQPSLLRIAPVAAPGSDPVTWPRLVDVQDDTIIARF